MSRVKDPELLDRLHKVWNEHGCAICRQGPVELHHVKKRSQGGGDTIGNILGLCGAYSKGQHHLAVENHTVTLVPSSGLLGWKDTRSGEWGYCSYPPDGMLYPPDLEAGANGSKTPPEVAVLPDGAVSEAASAVTVSAPARAPVAALSFVDPEERFQFLQETSRSAAKAYMAIAANLLAVEETGEWQRLDFESFRDYYGEHGLGLPQGSVSKMLKVAKAYRDEWDRAVATGASVEKLYLAARAADDVDEALGLAANMPTYELAALAKGDPPPGEQERCPTCGQTVKASNHRGDPKKEDDARSGS